jgi:hypothetical protein
MPVNSDIQEKKWNSEKNGWLLLIIIATFTLFILYGFGPISKRKLITDDEKIIAEFQGLLRYKKNAPLKIYFQNSNGTKNYRIRINKKFFYAMLTDKIVPEPHITYIDSLDYIYSFNFKPGEDKKVTFYLRPRITGLQKLAIGPESEIQKEMDIYIYP